MEEMDKVKKRNFVVPIVTGVVGAMTVGLLIGVTMDKALKKSEDLRVKMTEFYSVLTQWLSLRQEDKTLVSYFKQNKYNTVAIYGMKELGICLYDELKDSNIKVAYAIDKSPVSIYTEIDIYTPDDELPPVDVIVVTAIHYFDEIRENLATKVCCPIVSLEDVIYEI